MADILQGISQELGKVKVVSLDLLGLLKLDVTLTLSGMRTLSDALSQTLEQSGSAFQENVEKVVDAIRQLGVEDLRRWAEQGGPEEKSAFNQVVSRLQNAAQRGQEEAGNLLQKLGGKIAETGEKAQGAPEETRH